jgi:GNAT superfamily N-acetyltransferase
VIRDRPPPEGTGLPTATPPARSPEERRFRYPVRPYRPEHEGAVLDLLRRTVGETHASRKTPEFWRWKHVDNPSGASYAICAWDDHQGEPVGLRALMRWSMRWTDGTRVAAVRPVDTATHPGYQRRGIFSTLTRMALDELRDAGVALVFNTPNPNSLPGYRRMGWRVVGRFPLYVRPTRWGRTAVRLVRRGSASAESRELPTWTELRDSGERVLDLVSDHERHRPLRGFRTDRTPAFLDWRYGSHPEIRYGVHLQEKAGVLEGMAVCRPVAGFLGLSALLVTDVFLRRPWAADGAELLRNLARSTPHDYLVGHFAPRTVEHAVLLRSGFVRIPRRGYTLAARSLRGLPGDPGRARSWDLSLGDLEIF